MTAKCLFITGMSMLLISPKAQRPWPNRGQEEYVPEVEDKGSERLCSGLMAVICLNSQ